MNQTDELLRRLEWFETDFGSRMFGLLANPTFFRLDAGIWSPLYDQVSGPFVSGCQEMSHDPDGIVDLLYGEDDE